MSAVAVSTIFMPRPIRVKSATAFYAAFCPCFGQIGCWPTGIVFETKARKAAVQVDGIFRIQLFVSCCTTIVRCESQSRQFKFAILTVCVFNLWGLPVWLPARAVICFGHGAFRWGRRGVPLFVPANSLEAALLHVLWTLRRVLDHLMCPAKYGGRTPQAVGCRFRFFAL